MGIGLFYFEGFTILEIQKKKKNAVWDNAFSLYLEPRRGKRWTRYTRLEQLTDHGKQTALKSRGQTEDESRDTRFPHACSCLVNPGEEWRLSNKIWPQVPVSVSQYTTTVQVCHRAGVSTAKYSFQMLMGKRVYVHGCHRLRWYFFEDLRQDSLQITFTCEETVIRLSGLLTKQGHESTNHDCSTESHDVTCNSRRYRFRQYIPEYWNPLRQKTLKLKVPQITILKD